MRALLVRLWTDEDDHLLQGMLARKVPVRRISHKLNRSQPSIRRRMTQLGLHILPGTPTMNDMRRRMREAPHVPR